MLKMSEHTIFASGNRREPYGDRDPKIERLRYATIPNTDLYICSLYETDVDELVEFEIVKWGWHKRDGCGGSSQWIITKTEVVDFPGLNWTAPYHGEKYGAVFNILEKEPINTVLYKMMNMFFERSICLDADEGIYLSFTNEKVQGIDWNQLASDKITGYVDFFEING
jgi:hypothetical protein